MTAQASQANIPKLRFPEFTGDWEETILADSCNLQSGYAFSSNLFSSNGTKLVTPKNFTKDGDGNFEVRITKYTNEKVATQFLCHPNDLLVLLTDLTPSCALLGKPLHLKHTDGDVLLNQRIVRVENDKESLDTVFLKQFFLTDKYHKRIVETATGTTVRHSSNKTLLNTKIFRPNLIEQQKIASFLGAVDDKIAGLQNKKDLLEAYKKGMMQRLFSQSLRFTDAGGKPFPDWEEKKLGDVLYLQGGYAFKSHDFSKDGVPVVRISNISAQTGYIDLSDCVRHSTIHNDEKFVIKNGDVLIAMSGATTGKACEYAYHENAYLNQRVGLFKLKNDKNYYPFIKALVFSDLFKNQLDGVLVAGAQPNISPKDIEKFNFSFPHIDEQKKIADFLSAIDDKIALVADELSHAKAFKKGLLQQMFV